MIWTKGDKVLQEIGNKFNMFATVEMTLNKKVVMPDGSIEWIVNYNGVWYGRVAEKDLKPIIPFEGEVTNDIIIANRIVCELTKDSLSKITLSDGK